MLLPANAVVSMTGDVLVDRLLDKTQMVADVLGVTLSEAEVLVSSRDWNLELLIEDYGRDPGKTRNDVGLPVTAVGTAVGCSGHDVAGDTSSCVVCMSEVPTCDLFAPRCGHAFCKPCWRCHITCSIADGVMPIGCMETGCPARVSSFDLPSIGMTDTDVAAFRCASRRECLRACRLVLAPRSNGTAAFVWTWMCVVYQTCRCAKARVFVRDARRVQEPRWL